MRPDDELDRELRRLFSDERLDVPARAGAESEILAGARRVRRRRTTLTAAGGALTVALLVGAGILVTDLRSGHEQVAAPPSRPDLSLSSTTSALPPAPVQPAPDTSSDVTASTPGATPTAPPSTPERTTRSSAAPTTSSPRIESIPQATGPVLGPNGYGKLQLGMSFDDAKATGLLTGTDSAPNGCGDYRLTEGSSAVGDVQISSTYGIVGFQATGARTPEKIKVGSTKDQLETAYPNLSQSGDGYTAASGSGGTYAFSVAGGKVTGLKLVGSGTC